ncbi:MAG: protein kinase domain-containing protein [Planctomycetota bacterium]|jgi:serine/threonine-protein kinase
MNDKSILQNLKDAPRVQLEGSEPAEPSSERYQIVGEIARGGVGVVYKGRDADLGRDVAMKLLRDDYLEHPEILQRFIEEAQIGGQLQHPGIVPVYELGLRNGEHPYFAMKLVKGRTLAELLGERKDATESRRALLAHFAQVCQTVAYAHARGVIHRDLKPANVMIGGFGEVQVVDWGFAKVLRKGGIDDERQAKRDVTVVATVRTGAEGSASVAGSVMGTPAYMPPEQALGHVDDLTERADVFALGAILCEILTGAPPYTEEVLAAAAQARLDDAHARLDACGADPVLVTLGKECLSALPKDRPRTAREVADVVTTYLAEAESRAHQARVRAAEAEARSEEQRRARRQAMIIAAAVLTVVVIAVGAWLTVRDIDVRRERDRIEAYEGAVRKATRLEAEEEWTAAGAAAEQALRFATDDPVRQADAESLRERIRESEDAAERAGLRAQAEADLLTRLDEILTRHSADHSARRTRAEYADALPDAATVAAFARKEELARHFDSYAQLLRHAGNDAWKAADKTARALDPDAWRNRLRDALARADRDAVRALASEPDLEKRRVRSLSRLGFALGAGGERAEACRILRLAYEQSPNDFWVNHWLGKFAEQDEAVAHLEVALAVRPSPMNRNQLGVAYARGGNREAATTHYRAALRIDPEYAHAYNNLGLVMLGGGDIDGAEAMFRKTIEFAPDHSIGYYHLGNAFRARRDADAALKWYREALLRDEGDAQARTNLANTLIDKGDIDGAIQEYREALRADPKLLKAYVNLGFALLRKRDHAAAIVEFERAIAVDPEYALAHRCLGGTLSDRGDLDRAVASLERAIELNPNDPTSHRFLALTLGKKGDGAGARKARRRFVHLRVLALTKQGQHEAAAQFFVNARGGEALVPGDLPDSLRYDAACAAIQAGAKWHEQARAWLRADLAAWKNKPSYDAVAAVMEWQWDPRLAATRESKEWKSFWAEVDAALRR